MVKGKQAWIGTGLGLLVLIVVFFAAQTVFGGDDIAVDGSRLESAGDAVDNDAGTLEQVATEGADSEVRSFGADGGSAVSGDDDSGLALRVVTDDEGSRPTASTSSSTSSSTTAAPSTSTTAAITTTSSSDSTGSSTASTSSSTTSTTMATTSTAEPGTTATTATTATSAPPPSSSPSTNTTTNSSDSRGLEREVIRLTNEARANGGCGPLTHNDKLHAAALGHTVDMAENDYFSHTSQDGSSMVDRIERQGYQWRSLAENIAAGYRTPAAVVDGWMNSSGHRANILNCNLTEIGVGFHDYYWTQNFGKPA